MADENKPRAVAGSAGGAGGTPPAAPLPQVAVGPLGRRNRSRCMALR